MKELEEGGGWGEECGFHSHRRRYHLFYITLFPIMRTQLIYRIIILSYRTYFFGVGVGVVVARCYQLGDYWGLGSIGVLQILRKGGRSRWILWMEWTCM